MKLVIAFLLVALVAAPLLADTVQVEVFGDVEYNQVNSGEFGTVSPGDPVVISFQLDTANYVDSSTYPTRGYVIDQASFSLVIGPATAGLQDPFPAGQTPYFVMRNNDPAVDGFFLSSTGVDFPGELPLDVPGGIAPYFTLNYQVGYTGDTLASLDILDAVGTYDYTGLTSFYCTINDSFAEPIGWVFDHMVISTTVATEPATWGAVKTMFQ